MARSVKTSSAAFASAKRFFRISRGSASFSIRASRFCRCSSSTRLQKYKQYDEAGQAFNGIYANMFEEEYNDILSSMQREIGDEDYIRYLDAISAHRNARRIFSVDKKGHYVDRWQEMIKRNKPPTILTPMT